MQRVRHDFQRRDFAVYLGARFAEQLFQAFLDRADQDFAPALGLENDVVVQQKDAGFFVSAGLAHKDVIPHIVQK